MREKTLKEAFKIVLALNVKKYNERDLKEAYKKIKEVEKILEKEGNL